MCRNEVSLQFHSADLLLSVIQDFCVQGHHDLDLWQHDLKLKIDRHITVNNILTNAMKIGAKNWHRDKHSSQVS